MHIHSPLPLLLLHQCKLCITRTGNFPLMIPLFRHLYTNSKQGLEAEKLVKIALELVQARKESGQKVSQC